MNNQRQQEEKCECFCHKNRDRQPGEPFFCLHCQKEQPEEFHPASADNLRLKRIKLTGNDASLFDNIYDKSMYIRKSKYLL